MALKNAFDNLSTEAALRRIANLLTFARDASDRIRVSVDTGTVSVYNRNSTTSMSASDLQLPFAASSWSQQDARETQRVQMRLNADNVRRNRWTY